jgi:glycolate oxidase iron-sulfur subunit
VSGTGPDSGGRLGAFAGDDLPDVDALRKCVHCGICLPQCPTYRVLGEEMDSPRGRLYLMRAAAEGRIDLSETFTRHLDLCLGCRACETACPSGVPFGELLEATRGQIEARGRPLGQRLRTDVILGLFPRPRRVGAMLRALGLYQRSGLQAVVRSSGMLRLVPTLKAMDELLPPVPRVSPLPELVPAVGPRRGRVGLLTGCIQRFLYPQINAETARLLARAGWDVVVPADQGCCGALHLHAGRLAEFRRLAGDLGAQFPADLDHVVVNAAGCGSAMKEYGHWLAGDAGARALAAKTRDVLELLADAELPLSPVEEVATYHDACHLVHGQRIRAEPRALLGRIPGLRLVDLPESDLCCGSAGVYNLQEPAMADRLLDRKVRNIAATGARLLVAGNPGCLLQIAKGCRERGLPVEVVHPVEILGRAVRS